MSILDEFPSTVITVETLAGTAGAGDLYATAVSRPVFLEDKRRQVRDSTGELTISETTLYDGDVTKGDLYEPGSRVTASGRQARVIRCAVNYINDPDVDHIAVYLDHLGALS